MKTIEVVAAIIHQHGKILATQRGYGEHQGMWEFPGGKMETGETEEDAIVREIREELNVEIRVEKKVCTVEYDYPKFHLVILLLVQHRNRGAGTERASVGTLAGERRVGEHGLASGRCGGGEVLEGMIIQLFDC